MIRVIVVDDSLTMRKTVADRLRAEGLDVIGEAADGEEAVTLTRRLRPDVVLMDVVMPEVDGLAATRRIMVETPTPVVILSAHANREEVFKTYDALAAGALEVCAKPAGDEKAGRAEWDRILLTVGAAAQVPVTRLRSRATAPVSLSLPSDSPSPAGGRVPQRRIVVVGASTGGPVAVREILGHLPRDFPLPILLAIHCNSRLSTSIADWFDRECALHVCDARDNEPLPKGPGIVLTAPPGRNLRIRGGRTSLRDATEITSCTPSVDELFTSAAEEMGDGTIGVLLTGMGTDGAEGLKRIRDRGGCTIAQDKASCVVFGMPGAAIESGAAEYVAPPEQIPGLLIRLTGSSSGSPFSTGVKR